MTTMWTVVPGGMLDKILRTHGDDGVECADCEIVYLLREMTVNMDPGGYVFTCPRDGSILMTEDDLNDV